MKKLYTKTVEIYPGDTLVHEDGTEWIMPRWDAYIMIPETSIILRTGEKPAVSDIESLRHTVFPRRERNG